MLLIAKFTLMLVEQKGKPSDSKDKRRLNTTVDLTVDAHDIPLRTLVTEGTRADCKMAIKLIEAMPVEHLIADRAYDTNALVEYLHEQNTQAVIPPKRNRKTKWEYNNALYEYRHLVENTFLKLKQFRGIATRYAKSVSCFAGAIHLASIVLWLRCLV
ncbi:IS5 family transposase ISThsp20 [Fusobacterium necrophorum]|uniref:IS5 family transposase n=1 Tax=Fusobacterium necrophorum TaxID=859 RepID=UPI001ECF3533|nr:IS5 family transposase [Fusobacterium necrophorum]MBR8823925.1 IS5 family transposase ISThsp20 [Fusobacterium necrophorum]